MDFARWLRLIDGQTAFLEFSVPMGEFSASLGSAAEVGPDFVPMRRRLRLTERAAGEVSGGVRKTPVQGRIVTVTREGTGWAVIPLEAEPLADDLAAPLGRWLDLRLLLKGGTVKVGESWTVSGAERLAAMVVGKDAGVPEIRCTLGRIVPGNPAKAEVAVTVRMEKGKEGEENRMQGQLAGLLVIDTATGRPQSFSLSGSFRANSAARDANNAVVGRIEIQARQVALRLVFEPAGKP